MKTFRLVIFLAAILGYNVASASGNATLNLIPVEDQKVLVAFESAIPGQISLTLTDSDDRVVYYKSTFSPKAEYRGIYNLSELQDGAYTLSVNSGDARISRNIEIKNKELAFSDPVFGNTPVFSLNKQLLDISFLNNQLENVSVQIFRNNSLVYASQLGDGLIVQNRFDLSRLPGGDYRVYLVSGNDTYTFDAEI
ncbi:hypothetical protein BA6E_121396 [Bacteroidales bacterium 6E]|nr:hypothetical protein BA6E_121396 [Bacteroidales bacterium 6E]